VHGHSEGTSGVPGVLRWVRWWAGGGAGGQGSCAMGRKRKGMAMPVTARDQELDLPRPKLAALQHQVEDMLGSLHRLWIIKAAEENHVSFSALLLAARFVCLLLRLVLFQCASAMSEDHAEREA